VVSGSKCARSRGGFGAREVYEAEDGAAGLEAFTHYLPDIVIADWAMPILRRA
jgi:YesN/AraC family two-component response regulator